MCLEDVRIGRKIRTTQKIIVIPPATSTQIVAPSRSRMNLVLTADVDLVYLFGDVAIAGANSGFRFSTGNGPYDWSLLKHGQIIGNAIQAFSTPGATICVTESFFDESEM